MQLRIVKYGIGSIIIDCLLMVGAIIEICTGRKTLNDMLVPIILCAIYAIAIVALVVKYKMISKKQSRTKAIGKQHNRDDTK